jgi:AraC-like DNA-binding protein
MRRNDDRARHLPRHVHPALHMSGLGRSVIRSDPSQEPFLSDHPPVPNAQSLTSGKPFPLMASKVDTLSQMLTLIRLQGEVAFATELSRPWALQFPSGLAYFHALLEGEAWLTVEGGEPLAMAAGDLLLLPHGQAHRLGPPRATMTVSEHVVSTRLSASDTMILRFGDASPHARIVSGAFRFDGKSIPAILTTLPQFIHISSRQTQQHTGWIEGLARFVLDEAQNQYPGAAIMISRLVDLVVIRTLRHWIQTASPRTDNWQAALSDGRIGRVLEALHEDPLRRWSVADLAGIAGMSRSSFTERFTALLGEAPLRYQAHLRLSLAKDLLRGGNLKVIEVAGRVGYQSEAAFSRSFKAYFGHSPTAAKDN